MLEAIPVGTLNGKALYKVGNKVTWIHVTDPDPDWLTYGYIPCSPLKAKYQSGAHGNRIVIQRKNEDGNSLLRGRLSSAASIKSLTYEQLAYLAEYYGNTKRMSRVGYLTFLATKVCSGQHENDAELFVKQVLSMDGKKESCKVDPATESVFKEMDPDDKKEHASLGKKIEEWDLKRKYSMWESEQKKPVAKRRKIGFMKKCVGQGKGKGKGKPKPATDTQAAGEPVAAAGPIVRGPRDPQTFQWGVLGAASPALFHFALLQRSGDRPAGYKIICRFHAPEMSLRGRGVTPICCGREHRATDNTEQALATCLHYLMEWALLCESATSRNDHVFGERYQNLQFEECPRATLDNRCMSLCARIGLGLPAHIAS